MLTLWSWRYNNGKFIDKLLYILMYELHILKYIYSSLSVWIRQNDSIYIYLLTNYEYLPFVLWFKIKLTYLTLIIANW